MDKLSIIIPVYNGERRIQECLRSVFRQTYDNLEVIVIDDGSKDQSYEKIKDVLVENENKNIRVIVETGENRGAANARNHGIEIATGEWVTFIDQDDYIIEDYCEKYMGYLRGTDIDILVSGYDRVSEDGELLRRVQLSGKHWDPFMVVAPWAHIYRRTFLKENNIRFDEDKSMCEDACFDALYFQKCSGVVFIEEPLYYYRDNASSITHSYQPNLFYSHICAFALRKTIVTKEELPYLCDYYYFLFIKLLDNPARQTSFLKKMRYNNKMMKSEEFRFCVANATGKNDSKLFMKVVRMHNYYIYWAFQKICKIKDKILRKNKSE